MSSACFENAVGYGFAHPDAGDSGDDVVQALDMLDVERREDIDAGRDQLLDIEIALGMAAFRCVAVRQLVDQHKLRAALEDRVEVHFGEAMAFVVDLAAGNDFEAGEQRLGLPPAMGFDNADNDIDPLAPLRLRRKQHLVGLADTGRCAEKNLEPPAALLLGRVEQCLRRRSPFSIRHLVSLDHFTPSSARLSSRTLTRFSPRTPSNGSWV